MNKQVVITIGSVTIRGELDSNETAQALARALPCSGRISTWGEEVFFPLALDCQPDPAASEVVEAGALAYCVEGGYIAIGFGPTPISQGNEIRLAAPVNIWGRALDDVRALKAVSSGDPVTIDWAE